MRSISNRAEKHKPELLSPAGSPDSLRAALAAGADAVYFGATAFSNRARAKNFENSELGDAVKLTHSVGAKAYITLNTRVKTAEMYDILKIADILLGGAPESRADALIMADFGAAAEILKRYPHAVLHASTQTSLSSIADCEALYKLGFSRLVLPRELCAREIQKLRASSPIELEIFIHGAECVSVSGQCLMSYVMGGRSGNRGECAQPCRLPYELISESSREHGAKAPKNTPLSLSDMCLAGRMDEVISLGIDSFKIEGRLRSAEYVYGTTSIYRRLIDENRAAQKSELERLESLFTRSFSDGYYSGRYGGLSARSRNVSAEAERNISYKSELRARMNAYSLRMKEASEREKESVTAYFTARIGEKMKLKYISEKYGVSAECEGANVIPLGENEREALPEMIEEKLAKLGGLSFPVKLSGAALDTDRGASIPLKEVNALRRKTAEILCEALISAAGAESGKTGLSKAEQSRGVSREQAGILAQAGCGGDLCKIAVPREESRGVSTAEFVSSALFMRELESMTEHGLEEFFGYFGRIYLPAEPYADLKASVGKLDCTFSRLAEKSGGRVKKPEICAVLPMFPREGTFARLKEAGLSRALCHTVGQIYEAGGAGFTADVSFRANITSSQSFAVYKSLGATDIILSPELSARATESIGGGGIVYGRLPLMLLSRCIAAEEAGGCKKGNRGGRIDSSAAKPHGCTVTLRDKKGEDFPVISNSDCTNTVYNSHPTWQADVLPHGYTVLHYLFTPDSSVTDIIKAYKNREKRRGRR